MALPAREVVGAGFGGAGPRVADDGGVARGALDVGRGGRRRVGGLSGHPRRNTQLWRDILLCPQGKGGIDPDKRPLQMLIVSVH